MTVFSIRTSQTGHSYINNVWMTCLVLFLLVIGSCKQNRQEKTTGLTGDEAIDKLTIAISKSPQDPALYFQRSELFYEREAYDQAIEDLAQVLRLDSTNLKAHHLLADVYLDSYQSARA